MTINELFKDLIWRYMRIDTQWHLLAYMLTLIFAFVIVKYYKKKNISISRCILLVILFLYLTMIYMSTVMSRRYNTGVKISLKPFTSWSRAFAGNRYGIKLVVENLIMLMPIGFLLPFIYRRKNGYIRAVSVGFLFSLFIEISQYLRKTGLFEVDDLINNTLGVFIGCGMASLFLKAVQLINEHLLTNKKKHGSGSEKLSKVTE